MIILHCGTTALFDLTPGYQPSFIDIIINAVFQNTIPLFILVSSFSLSLFFSRTPELFWLCIHDRQTITTTSIPLTNLNSNSSAPRRPPPLHTHSLKNMQHSKRESSYRPFRSAIFRDSGSADVIHTHWGFLFPEKLQYARYHWLCPCQSITIPNSIRTRSLLFSILSSRRLYKVLFSYSF